MTQSQMLPGTIGWTSPRNHIGVHPESLLYHRDPEQLAADVIGLSEKYATLANEHVSCFLPCSSCCWLAIVLLLDDVLSHVIKPSALEQVMLYRSIALAYAN